MRADVQKCSSHIVTTEAEIRDHLIDHLDLIEPGLRLIEKEFKLPNADGAKGFRR